MLCTLVLCTLLLCDTALCWGKALVPYLDRCCRKILRPLEAFVSLSESAAEWMLIQRRMIANSLFTLPIVVHLKMLSLCVVLFVWCCLWCRFVWCLFVLCWSYCPRGHINWTPPSGVDDTLSTHIKTDFHPQLYHLSIIHQLYHLSTIISFPKVHSEFLFFK